MSNEENSIYKNIELMQEYIHSECEAYIYDPRDYNQKIFLWIKHITDALCRNAFILHKQHKNLLEGNAAHLSLEQIYDLLRQIYDTSSQPIPPQNKKYIIDQIINEILPDWKDI